MDTSCNAHTCRNFSWKLQGIVFVAFVVDMYLIPVRGCDVVLGIQWLNQLGTVRWNLRQLHMEFEFAGRTHVLGGAKQKCNW